MSDIVTLNGYNIKDEKAVRSYVSIASMKADTKLKKGYHVKTKGYYEANDGGHGEYIIVDDDTLVDDGGSIHVLSNGLRAKLIINDNTINVKQFGAYGDNTHDDINSFNNAIDYVDGKYMNLFINKGQYKLSDKIIIPWSSTNFWTGSFIGSYRLFGAGIMESVLNFTGKDGVLIQKTNAIMSMEISNFSIQNTSFDPSTGIGNERKPDIDKGVGLLLDGIGYTCRVIAIGVKGFYCGVATRHCYNGPIIENLFVDNCIFGYSSKHDTTIVHNSCNYNGLECGYIQEGSTSTLTNLVSEGNFETFKINNNNIRDKFEGRGFAFYNARVTGNGVYTERLWGNARYIEDSSVVELNPTPINFMHYGKTLPENAEVSEWLDNHTHNYDDVYVNETQLNGVYVRYIGGHNTTFYANINSSAPDFNGDYMSTVIFEGIPSSQGPDATYQRFYNGNKKPIVIMKVNGTRRSNFDYNSDLNVGTAKFLNNGYQENWNGLISFSTGRTSSSYSGDIDRVDLEVTHDLSGGIHFYKKTSLNGTQVDRKEVISISNAGIVTFPQNT